MKELLKEAMEKAIALELYPLEQLIYQDYLKFKRGELTSQNFNFPNGDIDEYFIRGKNVDELSNILEQCDRLLDA